jgi:hypothetical protein
LRRTSIRRPDLFKAALLNHENEAKLSNAIADGEIKSDLGEGEKSDE